MTWTSSSPKTVDIDKTTIHDYRNVLGTKNLGDILSERESIAHDMQVNHDDLVDHDVVGGDDDIDGGGCFSMIIYNVNMSRHRSAIFQTCYYSGHPGRGNRAMGCQSGKS